MCGLNDRQCTIEAVKTSINLLEKSTIITTKTKKNLFAEHAKTIIEEGYTEC